MQFVTDWELPSIPVVLLAMVLLTFTNAAPEISMPVPDEWISPSRHSMLLEDNAETPEPAMSCSRQLVARTEADEDARIPSGEPVPAGDFTVELSTVATPLMTSIPASDMSAKRQLSANNEELLKLVFA